MAARTTLSQLIDRLRTFGQAGTGDWTLGTAIYWDSDHLQQVLDAHRHDLYRIPLVPHPKHVGGSIQYFEYHTGYQYFEKTSGGTAIFVIEDGLGNDQSTGGTPSWSADYMRGVVTFTTDRGGTPYYVTGRIYDLNGAAADIWRTKADHYSGTHFDFSTDNMSVKRSQVIDHSLTMAERYEAKAWAISAQMDRGDEPW